MKLQKSFCLKTKEPQIVKKISWISLPSIVDKSLVKLGLQFVRQKKTQGIFLSHIKGTSDSQKNELDMFAKYSRKIHSKIRA